MLVDLKFSPSSVTILYCIATKQQQILSHNQAGFCEQFLFISINYLSVSSSKCGVSDTLRSPQLKAFADGAFQDPPAPAANLNLNQGSMDFPKIHR